MKLVSPERTLRNQGVRKVLLLTLLGNIAVSLAKLVFGYLANSMAVIADGFHSLIDGGSNIVGLVGLHFASQPPDAEHQYGHTKFELISAMAIAVGIFLTAAEVIQASIGRFLNPEEVIIDPKLFAVMIFSLTFSIIITRYESRKAKELRSEVLDSDASHTLGDVAASAGVIVSLVVSLFGVPYADAVAGIVMGVLIGFVGIETLRGSLKLVTDSSVIDPADIYRVANAHEKVRSAYRARTRGTSDAVFVDLAIQVDPETSVDEAHRIAHAVENSLTAKFDAVADIVIHVEPYI